MSGMYLTHIAHFIYPLLYCWDHFLQFPNTKRLIVLNRPIQKHQYRSSEWVHGVLKLLDISMKNEKLPTKFNDKQTRIAVHFYKNLGKYVESLSVLGHPQSNFRVLKDMVTSQFNITTTNKTTLILINRSDSRNISKGKRILDHFERTTNVQTRYIDDMGKLTFLEQLESIYQSDMIVGNGNQLTNLITLRKCASVAEVFPPELSMMDYFLPFVEVNGDNSYMFVTSNKSLALTYKHTHRMGGRRRAIKRKVPVHAFESIIEIINTMIYDRQRCCEALKEKIK